MIGSSRAVRVYARRGATDLRKGFNGLYGLIRSELGRDPLSGDMYLFVNRKRTVCKVMLFDGTGLCIFQKRLDRGRFACLWRQEGDDTLELTTTELTLFIEGSDLVGSRPLSPPPVTLTPFV